MKGAKAQVIVPRKGVMELQRLLTGEGEVQIAVGTNHIRVQLGDRTFTSKLIDGRFPDYDRVIPHGSEKSRNRQPGRAAAGRCSGRRFCRMRNIGVFGWSSAGTICGFRQTTRIRKKPRTRSRSTTAAIQWRSALTSIICWRRFRPSPVIEVEIGLVDPSSSCVVSAPQDEKCLYVVMPMRL